jgi:hypothetical protein
MFGGKIMQYITKAFLEALRLTKDQYAWASKVNSQLMVYRGLLNTYLPIAAKQNLHIIWMIHEKDGERAIQPEAVASQMEVVRLLDLINPEIVGMEGFSGSIFTVNNLIEERCKQENIQIKDLPAGQLDHIISYITNDPHIQPLLSFQERNPHINFCGVDDYNLQTFQHMATNLMRKANKQSNAYIIMATLFNESIRLRGMLMIAKLARNLQKHGKSIGALPVGFLHSEEIIELKEYFNANWEIYDAKNIELNSDLTK